MNDRKHIIVGLFVLGGLILLGTLIVWFKGVSVMFSGGYVVSTHTSSAEGIRASKRVHMDGIDVGEIIEVVSSQPAEYQYVPGFSLNNRR